MAGASDQTRRVRFVNANYIQGAVERGIAGAFSILIVTEDDERHVIEVPASDMAALVSLVTTSPVLLWDPEERTLIACNLVGEWLPEDWSSYNVPSSAHD